MDQDENTGPPIGLLLGVSLGVGAALGLFLAHRAAHQKNTQILESVEDLRMRTQQVLNELSDNVALIRHQASPSVEEVRKAGWE